MRTTALFAALAFSTVLTPVAAADLTVSSVIDAVTVYPRGADITRLADARLVAGDHTVIIEGLPDELDPASLRVDGVATGSLQIGSVDTQVVPVARNDRDEAERIRIEARIEVLQDERSSLDQAIRDADLQRRLVQQLLLPRTPAGSEEAAAMPDPAVLEKLLDLAAVRMARYGETMLKAQIRQREIDRAITDLRAELNTLAPGETARTVAKVHLTSDGDNQVRLTLRYRVNSASWQPYYEARLGGLDDDAGAELDLTRKARVSQATTERWDDVALTLSTARPGGTTSAPELPSQHIDVRRQRPESELQGKLEEYRSNDELVDKMAQEAIVGGEANFVPPGALKRKADIAEASIEVLGFQAQYGIAGRVSVGNDGTAKQVRIASETLATTLSAWAVPKLDSNAYLTAAFTLQGDTPLLPGQVLLFREGGYVGQGYLPLMAPGEEQKLGFGADDLVKVTRKETRNKSGEKGLISTDNVEERAWAITVKNLHKQPLGVVIRDQMPVSRHEDIVVEMLPRTTEPTKTDVDDRPGILEWSFELGAGADKAIDFGYRITAPKDLPIVTGMR